MCLCRQAGSKMPTHSRLSGSDLKVLLLANRPTQWKKSLQEGRVWAFILKVLTLAFHARSRSTKPFDTYIIPLYQRIFAWTRMCPYMYNNRTKYACFLCYQNVLLRCKISLFVYFVFDMTANDTPKVGWTEFPTTRNIPKRLEMKKPSIGPMYRHFTNSPLNRFVWSKFTLSSTLNFFSMFHGCLQKTWLKIFFVRPKRLALCTKKDSDLILHKKQAGIC